MQKQLASLKSQRGWALISAYSAVGFLVALSMTQYVRGRAELTNAERYMDKLQAAHLSESAIDKAILQMTDQVYDDIGDFSLASGSFSATINEDGDYFTVTATGTKDGVTQQVETVLQTPITNPFQWGMYGISGLQLGGGFTIDSYNSSLGDYASTVGSNGDIGTNSTEIDTLELIGTGTINGDVIVGHGGNTVSVIRNTGGVTVSGTESAAPAEYIFTPPEVPDGVASSGSTTLNGNDVLELPSGVYWYEDFSMSGNSQLDTDGPVVVFVSGDLDLGGSSVGNTQNPEDLIFYVVGDDESDQVKLVGLGAMACAIYAPNSDVSVSGISGNVAYYGAIIGNTVTLNGSVSFHYDEALKAENSSNNDLTPKVKSWRNVN